jgi:sortase A
VLAATLIVAGVLALLDAGITLVWQEPISALIAKLRQDNLRGTLAQLEHAPVTLGELHKLASLPDERRRVAYLAQELERSAPNGGAVGRIIIPHIGVDFVVVKGTDTEDLKSGPGVYSDTSFPGVAGTTAIAGHRTTYLAPFRHIDSLRPGDHILLDMPYAHFTYTVIGQRVVAPTDVSAAVSEVGYSRLVLSACTPLFSAAKRLLVYATLTRTVPVGTGRYMPGGELTQPIQTPSPAVLKRSAPPVLVPLKSKSSSLFV